jgi:hypothetical protein
MTAPLCVVCEGVVFAPWDDPMCFDCWFDGRAIYGPPWSREWLDSVEQARKDYRGKMPTAWARILDGGAVPG